ncbi:MAG TPA: hypothetical protein VD994_18925 [Prosthecobacter sp.]|nr:hypothetical protein [Prosthecobacter sp.]
MNWQSVSGTIVRGHRVASGLNGDPRFPGGTLAMQRPCFAALGLDLVEMHAGTLNVSIVPARYEMRQPRWTFPLVKWHPTEPAETFSFVQARMECPNGEDVSGWIYHPHPETKPEHFQSPDVLEVLMPFVEGLDYGTRVMLWVPVEEMGILG